MIQAHHKSLLVSALSFAAGIAIVFMAGTFHGPTRWANGAILTALLCIAGVLFVHRVRRNAMAALSGPTFLAVAALLGLILVRSVTAGFPRFALGSAVGSVGGISLVLLVASYCGSSAIRRRNLALGICLIIGASAGYGLVPWVRGDTIRCVLPMGHHNMQGALLALALPLQVAVCMSRAFGRKTRVACGITMVISTIGVLGTRSLGAAGGFGIALLLGTIAASITGRTWSFHRTKHPRGPHHWQRVTALVVGLGAASITALNTSAGSELGRRVNRIVLGGGDPSAGERAEFARGALAGVSDGHLWLGFGPGSTPVVYPLDLRQRGVRQPEGVAVTHLHSTPVQILYELGIIGILLTTLLAGAILVEFSRRLRHIPDGTDRTILFGVLLGGLAYGAQCMGDVNILAPAVPIMACVLLGLGLAVPGGVRSSSTKPIAAISWLVGTSLFVLVPLLTRASMAHRHHDLALAKVTSLSETNLENALAQLETAAELDPHLGFYDFEAGLLAEEMAHQDPTHENRWLTRADRHFAEAIWAAPTVPGFALHLGWLRLRSGDYERAASPIRLAAALEYRSTFALPLAGGLEWNLGHQARAIELFSRAIALRPICICGEMIQQEPVASHLDLILSRVAELDPISHEIAAEFGEECRNPDAIVNRVTLTRMDDQAPGRSRALYVFRRRGLPAFSMPLEMRLTERISKVFRNREGIAIIQGASRRIAPHSARDLMRTDFPEARAHIPPDLL